MANSVDEISLPLPAAPPSTASEVLTRETMVAPGQSGAPVTRIIVAVHGVGSQNSFGTLQSVVNRFCSYNREPLAVPLGSFHTGKAIYSLPDPYPHEQFQHLAFAEVYWAGIPREVVSNRYTLEDAQAWARSIVERLRMRKRVADRARGLSAAACECADENFERIKFLMTELIESLGVAERLCYVADKAGLFTFDLRQLLEDYLGDVQVVADFEAQRSKIVGAFRDVLAAAHAEYPSAEIHIVAHSEGTVVSLLGLLEAIGCPDQAPWLARVRGFMTFGSPIDKHIVLWPKLFPWTAPTQPVEERIRWRNYYDYGDPIGFELDEARVRLAENGLDQVFEFEDEHDHGFTRYTFPGKAHVDYWHDDAVFGHFIHTVVNRAPASDHTEQFATPPRDVTSARLASWALPYALLLGILFSAVYLVFKAVLAYLPPSAAAVRNSDGFIFWSVLGATCVVAGLTALARVPRLQKNGRVRAWIWAGCVSSGVLGWALLAWKLDIHLAGLPQGVYAAGLAAAAGGVYWASTRRPTWGMRPLLAVGAAAVAWVVFTGTPAAQKSDHLGPLWPVLLTTGVALYLWWLAALLLDLVCVWHGSIRQSGCVQHIKDLVAPTPQPAPLSERLPLKAQLARA